MIRYSRPNSASMTSVEARAPARILRFLAGARALADQPSPCANLPLSPSIHFVHRKRLRTVSLCGRYCLCTGRKMQRNRPWTNPTKTSTGHQRLFQLLDHYGVTAAKDREAWADRVMSWDGATSADLTRWHGALLAAAWLEVNVGIGAAISTGRVPECYRLTAAGRQALNRAACGLATSREQRR